MRRRFKGYSTAGSKLYGYNFNHYPKHDFFASNTPEMAYPVFPNSAGDDFWHCQCFRQRINSDIFALEYVTEGVFIFNQNGTDYRCVPGDVFLLQYGSDSSMRCETTTAVKKAVNLTGSMLRTLLAATGLDRAVTVTLIDPTRFDKLFSELAQELAKDAQDPLLLSNLSYSLLLALAEQMVLAPRPDELKKALQFIQLSLYSSPSLNDLAVHAGVSKATLHRLFREYLNTSPVNYFIEQKLARAQQLLEYYPVKQVSAMLNYPNAQYFSKEFKKHFGVSPKNFRKPQ